MLVREVYGLYTMASCHGDMEAWLDLWTDDAEWNSHLFTRKGKDELRLQWNELWVNFDQLGFLSDVGPVSVTGETARVESVAREVIRSVSPMTRRSMPKASTAAGTEATSISAAACSSRGASTILSRPAVPTCRRWKWIGRWRPAPA